MLRRFVWIIFIACPLAASGAGWQQPGAVTAVQQVQNGVEIKAGAATVRITVLSPSVVRVRYAPGGKFSSDHSWAVVESPGFTAPRTKLQETAEAVELNTGELRVRIEKTGARIIFMNTAGDIILQEHPGNGPAWKDGAFRMSMSMPPNEHYFGLGDKAGPLDHRNMSFSMWNTDYFGWQESSDPLYKSIPFFLAMRGSSAYGLFLDNTWRTWFDFGKESRDYFSFGSDGGDLDYYFFYGPDPRQVVSSYTALTGRTPLPPLVTLGYQQARYSYFPENRVREIAHELRARRIPADVIYLDIDYQQDNRPFTVDRLRFPAFEQMVRDLGQQGFKIVAITDLHLAKLPGYKPYDEGSAKDLFVHNPDGSIYTGRVWPGDSVFPDFTWAPAREWWGSLYNDFVKTGIRGFWNDMNEPAVFVPTKTMPLDVVHRLDGGGKATHREIHNIFGMQNGRATYEGLLRINPNQRPFVLTRAAFAGTQRYAASWTGDNSSTWNHYRMSIPTLLNLGISGYAFVGDDIGGFAGSTTADLLTRWMELGAFNPIFRNHTAKGTSDQEPWVHGPEQEAIRRRYIEARYRLLPYIYTAMEETARTGMPLMRPMFLEFPNDLSVQTNDTEFMFGSSLLVAPKTTEMLDRLSIHQTAGNWFDYWTGERVPGGGDVVVNPPLDLLPVYVREGSIIPRQPLVQNVSEKPQGRLELRVYPGPNCQGTIYADDGETFAYQRGVFQRTTITCAADGSRIEISAPEGSYQPWWSEFTVTVVGPFPQTPVRAVSPADAKPLSGPPATIATYPKLVVTVEDKTLATFEIEGNDNSFSFNVPAGRALSISLQHVPERLRP